MHKEADIRLPDPEKLPVNSNAFLRWYWYFLEPYKKIVIGFFAYRLIRSTAFGVLPLIIGLTVDALETGKAFDTPWLYGTILISYLLCFTIFMGSNLVFWFEVNVFEKAARALTLFSINHINKLPLNWHEKQGSGGKLQRVMTARKSHFEMGRVFRWTMMDIFGAIVGIIISVFITDIPWHYLMFYALFIVTYQGASWYFGRPVNKLYDRFHEDFEKLLSGVYEFVSSIRTVKSFHIEDYIQNRATELEQVGQKSIMHVQFQVFLRWSVINSIAGIWLVIFASVGFYDVLNQNISIGLFTATFFLAYNLWWMLETLAQVQEQIYEYKNGMMRLADTLKEKPQSLDLAPAQNLPDKWQDIHFNAMSFTYRDDGSGDGVHDIDIHVRRGEKIAFVGESGAGKSTLVKLIMKQMLPKQGAIEIDGTNLNYIPSDQWLSEIGFVPQDVELFNMTIRDNILIDKINIEDSVYEKAIDQAALRDLINRLPEGDQTIIGEKGIKLSGGQRQRLGIARALVRQSEIIIFDEATSSLDSVSEQKIQQAMENSFQGHTVFLIAHRLSTVRHVDKIIVLENGRIIEQGSFDDLIAHNSVFANLWSIQSAEKKEVA